MQCLPGREMAYELIVSARKQNGLVRVSVAANTTEGLLSTLSATQRDLAYEYGRCTAHLYNARRLSSKIEESYRFATTSGQYTKSNYEKSIIGMLDLVRQYFHITHVNCRLKLSSTRPVYVFLDYLTFHSYRHTFSFSAIAARMIKLTAS